MAQKIQLTVTAIRDSKKGMRPIGGSISVGISSQVMIYEDNDGKAIVEFLNDGTIYYTSNTFLSIQGLNIEKIDLNAYEIDGAGSGGRGQRTYSPDKEFIVLADEDLRVFDRGSDGCDLYVKKEGTFGNVKDVIFRCSDLYSVIYDQITDISDLLNSGGDFEPQDAATLSDKISSIGASDTSLKIDSSEPVASSLTIPDNVETRYIGAGSVNVASGQTLTINGKINAPINKQIFFGDGDVQINNQEIHAGWIVTGKH